MLSILIRCHTDPNLSRVLVIKIMLSDSTTHLLNNRVLTIDININYQTFKHTTWE